MTVHKSFKRLIRARIAKTGESYTAARAQLPVGVDDAPAAIEHLADAGEREVHKTYWRDALATLESRLEADVTATVGSRR